MSRSKKGITLTSIVVYVILFFLFTTVITIISTRVNKKLFDDRGTAINVNNVNKLEYNLISSADASATLTLNGVGDALTFSNGDVYLIDDTNGVIKKNGGTLIRNADVQYISYENGLLTVNITLDKYLSDLTRTIKINIGE